jgi:hypothetical protein
LPSFRIRHPQKFAPATGLDFSLTTLFGVTREQGKLAVMNNAVNNSLVGVSTGKESGKYEDRVKP